MVFDGFWKDFDVILGAFIVANIAFWSMSTICYILDHVPKDTTFGKFLLSKKDQGLKAYFTPTEFKEAATLAAMNMFLVSPLCFVPFHIMWNRLAESSYFMYEGGRLGVDSSFNLKQEFIALLVCAVYIDVHFYWTHRWLHAPYMYKQVHKLHHRFKAPQAIAAVYAHPFEFIFGNMAGIALGPMFTNAHPYTCWLWYAICLVSTCGSHSGYQFLQSTKHDDHHKFFNWNFGVGPLCDNLFGSMLPPHMKKE